MFSFSIIQIFNNSKSSVLSLQSSRSRRRQFSTTTTVRVLQYPQAARCNININIKISSISKSLQYAQASRCNIKTCTIPTKSIILFAGWQAAERYDERKLDRLHLQVCQACQACHRPGSILIFCHLQVRSSKFGRHAKHVTNQDKSWFSATSKSEHLLTETVSIAVMIWMVAVLTEWFCSAKTSLIWVELTCCIGASPKVAPSAKNWNKLEPLK